jgi:hypothetical protein
VVIVVKSVRRTGALRTLASLLFFNCSLLSLSASALDLRDKYRPDKQSSSNSEKVSCSPDKPVAETGGEVRVRVFVGLSQARDQNYSWKVTAGSIQGSGPEVVWGLEGVPSGITKATVTVSNTETKIAECSVEVIVIERERGEMPASRESTRTFLTKDQKEQAGYGLYSYILLGSPPTESSRVRYLRAIEAYLNLIVPLEDLQDNVAHSKLNVTYLTIKVAAPVHPSSEWLLENYDFGRARVLLDRLPGGHREGPYILSALKPLSGTAALSSQYLYQDLSTVPTDPKDLLSWWIREFQNQAAQERFWDPPTAEDLTLKLRTTISVLAAGLPEVQKQLAVWVTWTK